MPEQVIIEFISDTSKLKPATDQLQEQGKVTKQNNEEFKKTNAELLKEQKALEQIAAINTKINETGKVTKKNLADLSKIIKSQSGEFQKEIQRGVVDALHDAGVSVEEFADALENATEDTRSLKQQLKEMTAELAQMKVAGQDNTEQYQQLAQKAGQLKDAIGDANQEIKNFGSDTSAIDGVISLTQGLAGGFAVVQGAEALFGDESEELQKTLLRVNAVMAILQGLQQVQVLLQKESAAATLANTIATRAQTAAQVVMNFVIGTSNGLLKAFRIALAATGVGLLVIGIIELVKALDQSNDELERANALLETQKSLIEATNKGIEDGVSIEEARAEQAGKAESELIRIRTRGVQAQKKYLQDQNAELAAQRSQLRQNSAAWSVLNDQILANNEAINGLDNDILVKNIQLETQLAKEREEAAKKAADEAKKRAEEAARLAKERRAAEFADFKAGIELRLLAVKQGSEEELDLRKQLLKAELQIDLDNEKLTLNQRKLLIQKFFKERLDAEKKFNSDRDRLNIEDHMSDVQAELQDLELTNERRLELTEEAIKIQSILEINAANGNASKIEEINAKRDKAIRDARIASIQAAVDYENKLDAANSGVESRKLNKIADNAKVELKARLQAINQLTEIALRNVDRRIEALEKEKEKGLISQQEFELQYAQLKDEEAKIVEDAEARKQAAIDQTNEEAKRKAIETTQAVIDSTTEVVGLLDSLFQLQSSKENLALEERKKQIDELRQAGAITEKEAIARQKRLEADERRVRQQQAQREKTIAVFNAAIAVPQAILKGLATGGPILAGIYGAIALAQLLIVTSRPIPKFAKGKKDKYQGPGIVGEAGTELIESNGRMYVATKPEMVWLGKDDKVFNPQETMEMLSHDNINTERIIIPPAKNNNLKIDYDRFGKSVAKHVSTNVFVDGVQEQAIRKNEFTKWFTKRRSW